MEKPPEETKIEIDDLVGEMDIQMDEHRTYYNRETGEFVLVTDMAFMQLEDGKTLDDIDPRFKEERRNLRLAHDIWENDNYVQIPTQFEIHEWEIMKDFCYTIDDENIRGDLLNAIHGSGAFRMFKDKISQHGVRQDWFDYKKERFAEIAKRWCEKHDLEYVEDG